MKRVIKIKKTVKEPKTISVDDILFELHRIMFNTNLIVTIHMSKEGHFAIASVERAVTNNPETPFYATNKDNDQVVGYVG